MTTILQKLRGKTAQDSSKTSKPLSRTIFRTHYDSKPIPIPDDFLASIPDPSTIKVQRIDFADTALPEYRSLYAVILDNVLSPQECSQFIYMAEQSAGAHADDEGEEPVENNGWRPALVNAGRNHEVLVPEYRNSDRIIWDQKIVVKRIWDRVLQGEGMKEDLLRLEGKKYVPVVGERAIMRGEKYVATKQGVNERMRFLRYGPGQFFKEHCDGAYETEDGSQRSFYTIHIYLNDSAQALGIPVSKQTDLLRGGATTFHSTSKKHRLDVDPKAGRVLIFQHRRLLHSGDEVTAGVKYTIRSDIMYEYEAAADVDGKGDVIFE